MELFSIFDKFNTAGSVFTFWEIMINCSFATILTLIISYTYKKTHSSPTYSQFFVHTLFIMSLVTATIMMIIGSNIARAFTLVGALSIIRFRTAVKDARDTGFIFLTIAAGMASGTGFYLVGFLSTTFTCLLLFALFWSDYGRKEAAEKLLKVELPLDTDYENIFDHIFRENLKRWSLINTERFIKENLCELIFIVSFKKRVSENDFLNKVSKMPGINKVDLLYNDQKVEI